VIGRAPALLLALLLTAGQAAGQEAPDVRSLGDQIDQAVQVATGGGFWGTILVARGGETILARGYGQADYARRPNAPDTLFEIASTSKQFTAAAVLTLRMEGRLSLDTTLGDVFPETPPDKREITLDQLLSHTSGLSPDLAVPYAWPGTREEYVPAMLRAPLAHPSGTRFAYCNVGYALLAAVIEVTAGEPFEDYLRRALFEPAGLVDTGFVSDPALIEHPRSSLRLGSNTPAADWPGGWGYKGMGGVVTTAEDLLRWDQALRTSAVLDAEAKADLHRPRLDSYAAGWLVETTPRGSTKVHHSGGVPGYAAQVIRYLEEDALVVILSNDRAELGAVEDAIEGLLFETPHIGLELDVSPYELSEWQAAQTTGCRWEASATSEGEVRLELVDSTRDDHPLAVLGLPPGVAMQAADQLAAALRIQRAPGQGVDAGAYLSGYEVPADGRLVFRGNLELFVLPRYESRDIEGRETIDERVILVLVDTRTGQWPLLVLMDRATAEALLELLR
jgi:CubicO group peptidase (beta-lactamase class C family)